MELAPITLFTYNRPEHTAQTLAYLSENKLAESSKLIIFCDGPRANCSDTDLQKIAAVRQLAKSKPWCKEVEVIEAEENRGLAGSIVKGVTEVVSTYGKVIMLEDDMLTSPGFLQYMNDALTLYEDEEKVMHVSAYIHPFPRYYIFPETFLFRVPTCSGGWGVWKSSWQHYNADTAYLYKELERQNLLYEFYLEDSKVFKDQLERNLQGTMNTWFIKWYAVNFLRGGLSLHPKKTLVKNIGFDGSGEHTGYSKSHNKQRVMRKVKVKKLPIIENKRTARLIKDFFHKDISIKGKLRRLLKINF